MNINKGFVNDIQCNKGSKPIVIVLLIFKERPMLFLSLVEVSDCVLMELKKENVSGLNG